MPSFTGLAAMGTARYAHVVHTYQSAGRQVTRLRPLNSVWNEEPHHEPTSLGNVGTASESSSETAVLIRFHRTSPLKGINKWLILQ